MPTYQSKITNIVQVDPNTIEFDINIANTGADPLKLCYEQCGINFNYAGIANGGIITASFVEGSSQLTTPVSSANVSLNQTSKMIRVTASIDMNPANGTNIESTPKRIARIRLTNTNAFSSGQSLNFTWSFLTSSSTRTKTDVAAWIGSLPKSITIQSSHLTDNFITL